MNNKYRVGQRAASFETYSEVGPITGIALLLDEDNEIRAGSDDGYVMEIECPYGTQEMANALLLKLAGKSYLGYHADGAELDKGAELGDGIEVGGIYSMLAYRKVNFGPGHLSEISAPGENEVDHEYPYVSQEAGKIERNLATTRSLIKKTSEEILLKVEGKADAEDVTAQIKTALDGIELSVSSSGGSSTFKLMSDGVELSTQTLNLSVSAVNVTGKLTASQIDATNLKVSAANITGSLTIGQLPSNVATDDDIPTRVSDLRNDEGYQTESGVVEIIDGTVTADYINALGVSAEYLEADEIDIYDSRGRLAGFISTTGAASYSGRKIVFASGAMEINASYGSLYLEGGSGAALDIDDLIYCNTDFLPNSKARYDLGSSTYQWNDVYCSTGEFNGSDKNIKHDIEDLPEKYVAMLDMVAPKRYKLNDGTSGRYHVGFIAQDVEAAMSACGIDAQEFGGWAKDKDADGNDTYMLRYTEFIAILLAKLRGMDERIKELETAT